jgi:hypothetical protein
MQTLAAADHLDLSTWARRVLLQAVEKAEQRRSPRLKVAEEPSQFRARDKK